MFFKKEIRMKNLIGKSRRFHDERVGVNVDVDDEEIEQYVSAVIDWLKVHDGKMSFGKSNDKDEAREQKQSLMAVEEKIEQLVSDMTDWLKVHNGKMPSGKSKDKDEAREQKQRLQRLIDAGVPASVFLSQEEEIELIVSDMIAWLKAHDRKMPSGKSNDKHEVMLYQRFKHNKTKFTEEQKQRLIAGNVPAEALEKKTRVTIKPEDANKVLKQKTKADEKDGGITQ